MNIDTLWLRTLEDVVNRAAHEVKDSLNGVSLNVEVLRSRASRPLPSGTGATGGSGSGGGGSAVAGGGGNGLAAFATSAAEQLELLATRAEAVLFLARPPREPADVALVLQHLAALLTPAAKADGKRLVVDGYGRSAPTVAAGQATRLALAAGLLALLREGSAGRCTVESGACTVVRFSHESAAACTLDPAIAAEVEAHDIRIDRSGSDLILRFPRTT